MSGSITWRLALLFAVIQLATLAVGLAVMTVLTERTVENQARVAAQIARDDLAEEARNGGEKALAAAIVERLGEADSADFVAQLRHADGTPVAGNLQAWPAPGALPGQWRIGQLRRIGTARSERVGYLLSTLPDGSRLLTGQVLEDSAQLTRASEQSFAWALLVGLAIAVLATWVLLRLIERRIDGISVAAREIAAGRLNTRIVLTRSGDAFDRLGVSINAMLDRIEGLVAELRMVTDSMAHDLRSPVARVRNSLERKLGTTSDPAAQGALADAIEETDGLQRLIDTALEISRTETGIGRAQFERFDLASMLHDLAEVYGPLAEDEGFDLSVSAPDTLPVEAHRELLFRAISNLIDNALKYAEGGSRIALSCTRGADAVTIEVSDDGPGIPEGSRSEALRRFGRLDPARTRSGAGLGMALVSTIAGLHGGKLALENNCPHGLLVRLSLPIGG